MRTREEMMTVDRTTIKVTTIDEADETEFWLSRPPLERLAALELLRQIAYGYEPNSLRLQRVFDVFHLKTD